MKSRREKEIRAANALEDLTPAIKDMVRRIREGAEPDPYAAVYWLRREVGRVVASLGAGQPYLRGVETRYGLQVLEGRLERRDK